MALNLPPPPPVGGQLDRWLNLMWKKVTGAAQIAVTQISGMGTGVSTFLTTPSSANLRAALTDETGTGAAVFADSPSLSGTVSLAAAAELSFSGAGAIYAGGDFSFVSTSGTTTFASAAGSITFSGIGLILDQQSGALQIGTGGAVVFSSAAAPSSATDTGTAGEIRLDANYLYYCPAADTWKRVALATW